MKDVYPLFNQEAAKKAEGMFVFVVVCIRVYTV